MSEDPLQLLQDAKDCYIVSFMMEILYSTQSRIRIRKIFGLLIMDMIPGGTNHIFMSNKPLQVSPCSRGGNHREASVDNVQIYSIRQTSIPFPFPINR